MLERYGKASPLHLNPGTEQIARELRIRHPRVSSEKSGKLWQMTVDFLVVRWEAKGSLVTQAISVKPEAPLTKRQTEILTIEKEYWSRCGVPWLLFTPALFHQQVRRNLEQIACWLTPSLPPQSLDRAAELVLSDHHRSLRQILAQLGSDKEGPLFAQRHFWQAVHTGRVPLDLRIPIRPTEPISLLSSQEFLDLNPIEAGRSAWI
ncbi:hypothetical protein NBRC116584_29950 [Hydrogenophaga sp. 5NK40-0174]